MYSREHLASYLTERQFAELDAKVNNERAYRVLKAIEDIYPDEAQMNLGVKSFFNQRQKEKKENERF